MEVKIHHSSTIAETRPSGESVNLPLTIFDRFASNIHIAVLFAFTPPTPTNSHLVCSLVKTLHLYFPTLTAALGGPTANPFLVLGGGGGGALLVEADVESRLDDYLPLRPSPELARLHPPTNNPSYLLQVQLNRFQCGGLIVGVTAHHRVADGRAMSTFYVTWGKIARGLSVDSVCTYDSSWLKSRFPPICEYKHWGFEFIPPQNLDDNFLLKQSFVEPSLLSNVMIHYSYDFINSKLKGGVKEKATTFEVLLAHVWRKITIARGLGKEEETMIRVSVNGRPRLHPPVDNGFFGNLVLNAYPIAGAGDLVDGDIGKVANIIREAVRMIDNKYFQSFIDFGEVNKKEILVPVYDLYGNFLSPNLEVDSWLGFQFDEIDFGDGGSLCAFMPTWVPMDGLVIFLPSLSEEGGVDVFVALLEEHANILNIISHSLN